MMLNEACLIFIISLKLKMKHNLHTKLGSVDQDQNSTGVKLTLNTEGVGVCACVSCAWRKLYYSLN